MEANRYIFLHFYKKIYYSASNETKLGQIGSTFSNELQKVKSLIIYGRVTKMNLDCETFKFVSSVITPVLKSTTKQMKLTKTYVN